MKKYIIFILVLIIILTGTILGLELTRTNTSNLKISVPENNLQAIEMFKNDGIKWGAETAITVVDFRKILGVEKFAPYMRIYSLDTLDMRAGTHSLRISNDAGIEFDGVLLSDLLAQIKQLQADIQELRSNYIVRIN